MTSYSSKPTPRRLPMVRAIFLLMFILSTLSGAYAQAGSVAPPQATLQVNQGDTSPYNTSIVDDLILYKVNGTKVKSYYSTDKIVLSNLENGDYFLIRNCTNKKNEPFLGYAHFTWPTNQGEIKLNYVPCNAPKASAITVQNGDFKTASPLIITENTRAYPTHFYTAGKENGTDDRVYFPSYYNFTLKSNIYLYSPEQNPIGISLIKSAILIEKHMFDPITHQLIGNIPTRLVKGQKVVQLTTKNPTIFKGAKFSISDLGDFPVKPDGTLYVAKIPDGTYPITFVPNAQAAAPDVDLGVFIVKGGKVVSKVISKNVAPYVLTLKAEAFDKRKNRIESTYVDYKFTKDNKPVNISPDHYIYDALAYEALPDGKYVLTVTCFKTAQTKTLEVKQGQVIGNSKLTLTLNDVTTPLQLLNFTGPYIDGYPDQTFKPDQPITRKEFATALSKALNLATSNKIFGAIEAQPSGKKRNQDEPITRAEVAETLCRFWASQSMPIKSSRDFTLDTMKHPYAESIRKTMEINILNYDYSGNFNPEGPLTRGESAKVINTLLDRPRVQASTYHFSDIDGHKQQLEIIAATSKIAKEPPSQTNIVGLIGAPLNQTVLRQEDKSDQLVVGDIFYHDDFKMQITGVSVTDERVNGFPNAKRYLVKVEYENTSDEYLKISSNDLVSERNLNQFIPGHIDLYFTNPSHDDGYYLAPGGTSSRVYSYILSNKEPKELKTDMYLRSDSKAVNQSFDLTKIRANFIPISTSISKSDEIAQGTGIEVVFKGTSKVQIPDYLDKRITTAYTRIDIQYKNNSTAPIQLKGFLKSKESSLMIEEPFDPDVPSPPSGALLPGGVHNASFFFKGHFNPSQYTLSLYKNYLENANYALDIDLGGPSYPGQLTSSYVHDPQSILFTLGKATSIGDNQVTLKEAFSPDLLYRTPKPGNRIQVAAFDVLNLKGKSAAMNPKDFQIVNSQGFCYDITIPIYLYESDCQYKPFDMRDFSTEDSPFLIRAIIVEVKATDNLQFLYRKP